MTSAIDLALLTDLYELTMTQAFVAHDMNETATFSLFCRDLPDDRNFLLAAGASEALRILERLTFDDDALSYLGSLDLFSEEFLDWLGRWRFSGDVWGLREGTPFFANEPLLEVSAPLPEAQLVESLVMNQMHLPTLLASKAARVVLAAEGRSVVDFGMRRMHGSDAAMKAAWAFYVAGVDATSNVLAGRELGIPVKGTMAHSYVQAYDDELDAFRDFAEVYPEPVLLIDTYDVLEGARNVVRLAKELESPRRIHGVRIDSGDLGALARDVRDLLDESGLSEVRIIVSGGLDEHSIAELSTDAFPIDGFGVGTSMGVSEDAPALDVAYKLTSYAGRGRLKLSTGKTTLPCRKQVYREIRDGKAVSDRIALFDEDLPGEPLLEPLMQHGRRVGAARAEASDCRDHAKRRIAELPSEVRSLQSATPPYPVRVSPALERAQSEVIERLRSA